MDSITIIRYFIGVVLRSGTYTLGGSGYGGKVT